ncbi:MAG TPA: acetylglutamate kinase [Anaerolineae bacterium]
MPQLIEAETPEQLGQVKQLFIEYAAWLGIDLSFQGFAEELEHFPGDYAPPRGRILLALEEDGQPAGCVALHEFERGICEMKRMYVRESSRGKGIGRLLAQGIIAGARQIGYTRMRLDTLQRLRAANVLYRSLGFQPCAPYRYNPIDGVVYMELKLSTVQVYKVSGSDLDDPAFSQRFARCIADIVKTGARPVIVHGGGKELTALLKAFQVETRFVDGLRVTDTRTRDMALMTLSGLANKRLVAALLAAGVDALGVSGVDAGLVRVAPLDPALQYVGKPVSVRANLLEQWTQAGLVPVIAPMSVGQDGDIYNVNADHVAGAVAAAMDAELLTFVTNVEAVLDRTQAPIASLTAGQAEALIADGTINGGMIPKVRTALEALLSGVRHVRITNLDGISAGTGTTFTA